MQPVNWTTKNEMVWTSFSAGVQWNIRVPPVSSKSSARLPLASKIKNKLHPKSRVTVNNASDYRANGLLTITLTLVHYSISPIAC